ncbi:MAG: DNA mismatch repair protein MutS, partial [Clostridia bacterium]|nr:DNA mismatch repair protein MutS [Clostridia bacterium]
MEKVTPMMQQYLEIKEQCKDAILFFRLGDFYEMFFEDAKVASGVLEIALTGKSCGLEERAPMCGVPFHSADSYIARLVEKGYRVAICEQAEDPKSAKGLVRREIVRVVTPGTILDEGVLASRKTNYMCAAIMEGNESAVVFCEASTGQMMATHFDEDSGGSLLAAELMRMMPVEVIYNLPVHRTEALMQVLEKCGAMKVLYNDMYFAEEYAKAAVVDHFGPEKEEMPPLVVRAVGGLLSYLAQLQKLKPMHITDINLYTSAQFMELDATATANLELCNAMYDKGKKGSLLWVLDRCKTGMGARTMRSWLIRPLLSVTQITARHEAVEELM